MYGFFHMIGFDVWDIPHWIINEITVGIELPIIRRVFSEGIPTWKSGFSNSFSRRVAFSGV
jgi:hypothetical protein